jgi:flagellar basal-body rod modification protein FlgD
MQLSGTSAAQLKDQFLTLLVTQLQHQDPLDPVKQEDFIAQLAQFSVVEGVEELNVQFSDVLYSQQVLNGFNLVDKEVSYLLPGDAEPRRGHVDEVFIENGAINIVVGEHTVPISQVLGVFSD